VSHLVSKQDFILVADQNGSHFPGGNFKKGQAPKVQNKG
jgi:hypothetical protein